MEIFHCYASLPEGNITLNMWPKINGFHGGEISPLEIGVMASLRLSFCFWGPILNDVSGSWRYLMDLRSSCSLDVGR